MPHRPPIELDPRREPWDRQPGEPAAQYHRARVYWELGPARTLRQAAESLTAAGEPVTHAALRAVAATWRWRARADAWDLHCRQLHLARLEAQRRDLVDRHLRLSRDLLVAVQAALAVVDPAELRAGEIARLAEVATRIEREALAPPPAGPVMVAPGAVVAGDAVALDPAQLAELAPAERSERLRQLATELTRRAELMAAGDELDAED